VDDLKLVAGDDVAVIKASDVMVRSETELRRDRRPISGNRA
jgi:hypothetical protein